MPPMKDFILNNWGSLASVLGLVFSFLAFLFSKGASKAARQARDLAQSRSLAQDMNNLDRIARDLVSDIDGGRGERACERTRELISQLQYLCARWVKLLSKESKDSLMTAREQLVSVHEVLVSNSSNAISAQNRPELIKSSVRASEVFSKEYGAAVMASDFAGEQWKGPSLTRFWRK
jgi:hypothetical protein